MQPVFFFAAVFVATFIFMSPASVNASKKTIVLIEGPQERFDMNRLHDTVQAHMSDFNAKVVMRSVVDLPQDLETQLDVARALLRESASFAAVWIDYDSNNLMLLVSDHGTEQILTQSMAGHIDDKEQIVDAAAAVVRAALTPWLTSEEPVSSVSPAKEQASKEDSRRKNPPEESSKDSPRSALRSSQNSESVRSATPRFSIFGGYTLSVNLEGTPLNGGLVGAEAGTVRFLHLGIDLRIFQTADMHIEDRDVRLFRMLPSPWAGFCPIFGATMLCLKAKITFDIGRVLGLDESDAPPSFNRTRIGFSPSVFIRYRPMEWMGIDAEVGADIFGEPYHYRWNGEVVFTNGQYQPGASLCVSFLFPSKKKELRK
jgi:hypothetical protein